MSNENERPMSDKKKKKPKPYKRRKKREAEKQKNATWHSESEKKRNSLDGVLDLLKEKKRSHSILSFPRYHSSFDSFGPSIGRFIPDILNFFLAIQSSSTLPRNPFLGTSKFRWNGWQESK